MKSKFLAGFIATIVSILVVVGLALFLTLVIEVDPSKNWFTITAAFLTIASWLGVYKWLKPKGDVEKDKYGFDIEPGVEQIDATVFKAAYLRTSKKAFRVGVFFAILTFPGVILILVIAKEPFTGEALGGLITLIVFTLIGLLVMRVSGKKKANIKNGTDPLIHAIDNNITDHVVWFHGVVTSQQGMPIKDLSSYTIMIYTKDFKKTTTLGAKNEKTYDEIMLFLENKFPDAEMGHSPEIKKLMKEKYGHKGLM